MMWLGRPLAFGLLLALMTLSSAAQPAGQAADEPAVPADPHTLTEDDLGTFFDGFVPYAIADGDIAGATISVVKDGRLLFARGYGFADLKTHRRVDPSRDLFRVGSISKTFTWTSVMQLVEAGKLDLDSDVNDYLDFRIPEKYGKITLRDLMTHTPGFEDTNLGSYVERPQQVLPLGDYLEEHIPAEIFPPGKVIAYSNYGATLAGYIVQRVSGEPFAEYVESHVLKPLGMNDSSFESPLRPALAANLAKGYKRASEATPFPPEIDQQSPAGGLTATATDMARFMIAHLNGGALDGARILNPETEQQMQTRNYTLAPHLLNGFDLGFYEENRNGHRIIGHAGDELGFHSDMHLILDANTGIFMSFNSTGKDAAAGVVRTALFRAFLDRYFPYVAPAEKTVSYARTDAARVAGFYLSSVRIESALRLVFQLGQTEVTTLPDGRISVADLTDFSDAPKTWREVGPLLYREEGGQALLEFVPKPDGSIDYFASDDTLPVELMQRVGGLEQLNRLMLLGIGTIVGCLFALVIWLGGAIARWRFGRALKMTSQQALLRFAARIGAALYVLIAVGWASFVAVALSHEFALVSGALTPWFRVLYILGVLGVIGGIAMVLNGASRGLQGPGGWLVRAGDAMLGVAGLYGIYAIFDYGLASFSFTF
jgi:CubicO group peptidase (beta-lactamase class C family)